MGLNFPLGHCHDTTPTNAGAGDSSYGASEGSRRLWRRNTHSGHPSAIWPQAPDDRYGGLTRSPGEESKVYESICPFAMMTPHVDVTPGLGQDAPFVLVS